MSVTAVLPPSFVGRGAARGASVSRRGRRRRVCVVPRASLTSDALSRVADAAAALPPVPGADFNALVVRLHDAAAWAAAKQDELSVTGLPDLPEWPGDAQAALEDVLGAASSAYNASVSVLTSSPAALASAVEGAAAHPEALVALATSLAALSLATSAWGSLDSPATGSDPLQFSVYDPEAALRYFRAHPQKAFVRAATVARLAGGFLAALSLDRATGREAENAPQRAAQLRTVLTQLGPAAVKVGQVLSARVDLLPPAYLEELRRLQDSVAPFPEAAARAILASELPPGAFASLSPAPVASASLGQVYRGTLADGSQVAVKVQRPDVAEGIALDLLLLRSFVPTFQKWRGLNTDLVALVDEWGARFVAELDYRQEAKQGSAFIAAMSARGLGDSVTAAPVVEALSTRRVLTTAWIDGTRIDNGQLDGEEAKRMVELALAAYLTMLLDTGSLHADPHPGNLLRTPGGTLVILDWGLVTPVTQPQQLAILTYIGHLVGKDFSSIAGDLQAMGFVPDSKLEALRDSGVTAVLAEVFRALAKGGGARQKGAELRAIAVKPSGPGRVEKLSQDIADIQAKYGNILQIPAYFAYILRAFSVLEGIGLAADPQFSIASACFPYIARRLLSDPHPQAEAALEGILYGPRGRDAPLDTHRVRQLATAFRSFGDVTNPQAQLDEQAASSPLGAGAKEAIRLALSPQGGPLQRVLLRELAKVAASAAAVGAQAVATTLPGRFAAAAMDAQRAAVYQAVGSARWMAAPLTLPADMLAFAAPLMRATPGDEQRLEAARAVVDMLFESSKANSGEEQQKPEEVADRVRAWFTAAAPMLPELAPGLAAATLRFGSICLEQAAGRIAAADKEDRATGGDGLGAPPRV